MDYSTYYAEKRAGVYDDDIDKCVYCEADPCVCDEIYDDWMDREYS